VQKIMLPAIIGALEIKAIYGLAYRYAAIVAAARALDCRELLSDGMSHGQKFEGLTVYNPYR
jgi:predicted nucleic acid-binding protein